MGHIMNIQNVKQQGPVSNSDLHKIVKGSFAGALLEWYDFFIFGTAASIIFGPLFFPSDEPIFGIMASFATFGVGFLARPLGGIVFGHFGDKVGRKVTLMWTLYIVGISTFCIGLIPTYSSAGIWAPTLLVILRLIQGFGLGGEYGGASLIAIEAAPIHRRGFIGSLPQVAASAGIMLATGVYWVLNQLLTPDQMLSWGWRIPFLLSSVMAIVGIYIRTHSVETLHLSQKSESGSIPQPHSKPVITLFKDHSRNVYLAFGARLAETVTSNTVNAFAISYVAVQLSMGESLPLRAMIIAAAIGIGICPIAGWLSDKYSQHTLYKFGALFVAITIVPYFLLLNSGNSILITLAMVLAYNLGPTIMFAVQPTMYTSMFHARVRYTGLSVAYQFSAIIGGMTPLICTWLLNQNDGKPWFVAIFVMAIASLSFICVSLINKNAPLSSQKENEYV